MDYSFESSLQGKVCLITGGTKGIGKECAVQLAKMGASVAIAARKQEELNEATNELKAIHENVIGIRADVSVLEDIKNMMQQVSDTFGTLDILINNAGTNIRTKALQVTEKEWDTIMNVNLKGAFFCAQEAAKMMNPEKVSKIINISSQYGHVGSGNRTVYCTSKGGVELMTKALAVEWAPRILVNSVAPTFIETDLTKVLFEDEETTSELLNRMPMKKLGSVSDVVGAVLYLASDLSNMVTGTSVLVDGGWTAC